MREWGREGGIRIFSLIKYDLINNLIKRVQ